jgi:pyruvate,water dikinase
VKRFVFQWSLKKAQRLTARRENWKDTAVRQIAGLRRLLVALGERLARRGVLERPEDVFFLHVFEVAPVSRGAANFEIRRTVRERRLEYERNSGLRPPALVGGEFDPERHRPPLLDHGRECWSGLPVYPGVVEGKARVIRREDDRDLVQPGEILVAPFTDPAWTPYFVPAAGVVMDQGGILSHGSIIAREYGIPAITNAGSASAVIRTGQRLRLDATAGTVAIIHESPAE